MAKFIRTDKIDFIDVIEGPGECSCCFSQWITRQGYKLNVKRGGTGDLGVLKYLFKSVIEGNDQGKGPLEFTDHEFKMKRFCVFSNYIQLWRGK